MSETLDQERRRVFGGCGGVCGEAPCLWWNARNPSGRTATFSECRAYRYTLRVVWDQLLPVAGFVGLNPSRADEVDDDPTIRRCIGFAKSWGCGGILMVNLFAFRATDPRVMKAAANPVGLDNDLATFLETCDGPRVACWGTHGNYLGRGKVFEALLPLLPSIQCFGRNRDGTPMHPLYLRADRKLEPFGGVP